MTFRRGEQGMKQAVIIGAGPAGLAAGDFLCMHGIRPLILEKEGAVGGLSRTLEYKGYHFDVGGHRFFTKNSTVLAWWQGLLKDDFLKTARRSRIYYNGVFFNYPISIPNVIANLGLMKTFPILLSYIKSRAFPDAEEINFEKFVINRFGRRLYQIFFKEFTEKVWGMPCNQLSANWAKQRIKGLSLSVALRNALLPSRRGAVKTLIKEFYYPRLGSGTMYEKAAQRILQKGGQISLNSEVVQIQHDTKRITGVQYKDTLDGKILEAQGSDFCSSMPLTDLLMRMDPAPPEEVRQACARLHFRSLVIVYLIINQAELFQDNWIYVNSNDVKICRIINYKNWSRDAVPDSRNTSLGLEYFCAEGDAWWSKTDGDLIVSAVRELEQVKLACASDVEDAFVVRFPKAYSVYENNYMEALDVVKKFVKGFLNLQCIGRYGMFRYNNMDHSILTGFLSAKNIMGGHEDTWSVNIDEAYLEELAGNR
jgi:protoporphyrinogen oxidase